MKRALTVQQHRHIPLELLRHLVGAEDDVGFDRVSQQCLHLVRYLREVRVSRLRVLQPVEQQQAEVCAPELSKKAGLVNILVYKP